MAVKKRPYFLVREGKDYMVDAVSRHEAIAIIAGDIITKCEPASGAMVAQFLTAGGKMTVPAVPEPPKAEPELAQPLPEPEPADLPDEPVADEWPVPKTEEPEYVRGVDKDFEYPGTPDLPEPTIHTSSEY